MLVIITVTLLLLDLEGLYKVYCSRKHTNAQTHKREPAQTIEAHQNTLRVISLSLSLHAHAHLTLHSCVHLLVLASKQEMVSEGM
jgi:hypothetical protein